MSVEPARGKRSINAELLTYANEEEKIWGREGKDLRCGILETFLKKRTFPLLLYL